MIQDQRSKTLYFSRDDDSACVDEKIRSAFGLDSFNILECDNTGHRLFISSLKSINGNQAIERRKALYLCEVSNSFHIFITLYILTGSCRP